MCTAGTCNAAYIKQGRHHRPVLAHQAGAYGGPLALMARGGGGGVVIPRMRLSSRCHFFLPLAQAILAWPVHRRGKRGYKPPPWHAASGWIRPLINGSVVQAQVRAH